jgi:hypothetical protein
MAFFKLTFASSSLTTPARQWRLCEPCAARQKTRDIPGGATDKSGDVSGWAHSNVASAALGGSSRLLKNSPSVSLEN